MRSSRHRDYGRRGLPSEDAPLSEAYVGDAREDDSGDAQPRRGLGRRSHAKAVWSLVPLLQRQHMDVERATNVSGALDSEKWTSLRGPSTTQQSTVGKLPTKWEPSVAGDAQLRCRRSSPDPSEGFSTPGRPRPVRGLVHLVVASVAERVAERVACRGDAARFDDPRSSRLSS